MTQIKQKSTPTTTTELLNKQGQTDAKTATWDQYCAINDWSDACRVYDV